MKSVFAGMCISLGCVAYVSVGDIVGAILFSFGLLVIVTEGYDLFTGKAGFAFTLRSQFELIIILLGNLIGCNLIAVLIRSCDLIDIQNTSNAIIESHMKYNYFQSCMLAILCGFIMTSIINCKNKTLLPILLGIPVFILSGFIHCVADAFYICVSNNFTVNTLIYYSSIALGNYIGCIIPNINMFEEILWKN